jgi:hypothetical protein
LLGFLQGVGLAGVEIAGVGIAGVGIAGVGVDILDCEMGRKSSAFQCWYVAMILEFGAHIVVVDMRLSIPKPFRSSFEFQV